MASEAEREATRQVTAARDDSGSDTASVPDSDEERPSAAMLTSRHARHPWSHRHAEAGGETGSR
jgi:hypothetical protein